jgi:hypothetical protein
MLVLEEGDVFDLCEIQKVTRALFLLNAWMSEYAKFQRPPVLLLHAIVACGITAGFASPPAT